MVALLVTFGFVLGAGGASSLPPRADTSIRHALPPEVLQRLQQAKDRREALRSDWQNGSPQQRQAVMDSLKAEAKVRREIALQGLDADAKARILRKIEALERRSQLRPHASSAKDAEFRP